MAQRQEWSASGADCCSPFTACLLSWCVPCVQYGRINHRMHKDSHLKYWSVFNGDCCAYYALSCIGMHWIVQMMSRAEIREKYQIEGNGCTDCLCACCCQPCDLVQQEKEIANREAVIPVSFDVQPNKLEQENQMQYPPQQQQQQQYPQQQQQPQYAQQQQQPQYPQQTQYTQ